ncbi:hypothetical protein [Acetivibrio ethanolgignens]|uniref:hypothetical protein n=1 Tax=Acetivibrio ethanolgignens TaxID=290052 RepID=UPI000A505306
MSKPYKEFEPKWVKEAAPKDSYRSIFRWGDPEYVKYPKESLYKLMKEKFALTDDDFREYTGSIGMEKVVYGPGIGEGYEQLVMIVSRASGAPVIANAIRYAAQLVRGKVFEVAKAELEAVKKAGLKEILDGLKASQKPAGTAEAVKEPPKEIVTSQISGIEVMDLEDAVKALWKINIYAESGMGCTGPIIRVSDANLAKAEEELKKVGYIQ